MQHLISGNSTLHSYTIVDNNDNNAPTSNINAGMVQIDFEDEIAYWRFAICYVLGANPP